MDRLTSRERIGRMYDRRDADRAPIFDGPWGSTIARWTREGMPEGADYVQFFGLDRIGTIAADHSPRYPERTLEETDEFVVQTTSWGVTLRRWKNRGGVPEFLDYTVRDADTWRAAKARMTPDRDRIDWALLEREYPRWQREGYWTCAHFWFGFDVAHSWMLGTERMLVAMADDPEWVMDMFNTYLDMNIALFEMVWDAGYHFDEIVWPDDMGFKQNQFFSLSMYRELLKPVHRRAVEWAHRRGAKAKLHSCGDIRPLVPDLVEIGVDQLNPLEVKAGMDPIALKKQYGDRLAFHGGLNAVLYEHPERMWDEMRRVVPAMNVGGGYMIGSDHSVPESVSLEQFREFVRLAKELGSFA